jgi:hypothetical protein
MRKITFMALVFCLVVGIAALAYKSRASAKSPASCKSRASAGAVFHPCPACDSKEKVTICHVDGQAGSQKCQTLDLPGNAACQHIGEQGTPAAGHESDYCGPCNDPCQ